MLSTLFSSQINSLVYLLKFQLNLDKFVINFSYLCSRKFISNSKKHDSVGPIPLIFECINLIEFIQLPFFINCIAFRSYFFKMICFVYARNHVKKKESISTCSDEFCFFFSSAFIVL